MSMHPVPGRPDRRLTDGTAMVPREPWDDDDCDDPVLMRHEPTPFTCPRCATVTWRRADAHVIRCRYCDHMFNAPGKAS